MKKYKLIQTQLLGEEIGNFITGQRCYIIGGRKVWILMGEINVSVSGVNEQ